MPSVAVAVSSPGEGYVNLLEPDGEDGKKDFRSRAEGIPRGSHTLARRTFICIKFIPFQGDKHGSQEAEGNIRQTGAKYFAGV